MPRGNGTGPMGAGPMTGRGAGFCTTNGRSNFPNNAGGGRGRGLGLGIRRGGGGFGFNGANAQNIPAEGYNQPQTITPEQEKEYLKNEMNALENELNLAKKRLEELDD